MAANSMECWFAVVAEGEGDLCDFGGVIGRWGGLAARSARAGMENVADAVFSG